LLVFFSCAYNIYLFSLSQHGKYLFKKQSYHIGFVLDYLILLGHWLPLNLFILFAVFLVCFFSLYKISLCGSGEVILQKTLIYYVDK
jgi:hypothetical protein